MTLWYAKFTIVLLLKFFFTQLHTGIFIYLVKRDFALQFGIVWFLRLAFFITKHSKVDLFVHNSLIKGKATISKLDSSHSSFSFIRTGFIFTKGHLLMFRTRTREFSASSGISCCKLRWRIVNVLLFAIPVDCRRCIIEIINKFLVHLTILKRTRDETSIFSVFILVFWDDLKIIRFLLAQLVVSLDYIVEGE